MSRFFRAEFFAPRRLGNIGNAFSVSIGLVQETRRYYLLTRKRSGGRRTATFGEFEGLRMSGIQAATRLMLLSVGANLFYCDTDVVL